MTENLQADCVQSRQAGFIQCFPSAVMSKPSGGIRSLHSLSACGLPTPIVALAGICDVDIRVFSGAGG